jgi:hypothetical protein
MKANLAIFAVFTLLSTPLRADDSDSQYRAESDKLSTMEADYRSNCSTDGLKKLSSELDAKNQLTGGASAALERARLRISCGTLAEGPELFACKATSICRAKWGALVDQRVKVLPLKEAADKRAAELPHIPLPPPEDEPETKVISQLAVTPRATGQSKPVGPTRYCSAPPAVNLPPIPNKNAISYRRQRMWKEIRYNLCKAQAQTPAQTNACERVIAPMTLAEVRLSKYYRQGDDRAKQRAFFDCATEEFTKSVGDDYKNADIRLFTDGVEPLCLERQGEDAPAPSELYLADAPDCRYAGAAIHDKNAESVAKGEETGDKIPDAAVNVGAAKDGK